jgi:hypothetical protein
MFFKNHRYTHILIIEQPMKANPVNNISEEVQPTMSGEMIHACQSPLTHTNAE